MHRPGREVILEGCGLGVTTKAQREVGRCRDVIRDVPDIGEERVVG